MLPNFTFAFCVCFLPFSSLQLFLVTSSVLQVAKNASYKQFGFNLLAADIVSQK